MTKKVPPKTKAQEPKAQPKVQAPKGRNISAQGNALGNAFREDQSPEGAAQKPFVCDSSSFRPLSSFLREPLRNGHSATASSDPNGIRTLTLTAVTVGDFSERNTKITSADAHRVKDLWLEPGDILIQRSNAPELVGTSRLYSGDRNYAIFPDLMIRVRLNDEADPRFIELVLQSEPLRQYFKGRAKGMSGSMPKIDQETISEAPIPHFHIDDQRRIVAEIEKQFTRLEAGVAALRRVQANLKRYRAAVLKAACEGHLVQSDIKSWKQSTIAESIQIIDYRGRTPPFADEGIPHLRSQNVKEGRIVWKGLTYVTAESYDAFMTRGIPRETDVLFTTEAPMGEVAMAPATKFCLAQRIMVLRTDPNVLDGRFLMIQLRSPDFQSRLTKSGTGSTVTGVSSRNFQPMAILIPPLAEQTRIVAEVERRLSVVEEQEAVVTTNLQRATRLRQAVLQRAFSGNLFPNNAINRASSILP